MPLKNFHEYSNFILMRPAEMGRVDKMLLSLIVTRGLYRKRKETRQVLHARLKLSCLRGQGGEMMTFSRRPVRSAEIFIFIVYSEEAGSGLRRGFFLSLRRVPPASSYSVESSP